MPDKISSRPRTEGRSLLKADSNQDADVFALRAEFERLTVARGPLARAADGLGATFNAIVLDEGYGAAAAWSKKVNLDPILEALEELNLHADRNTEQMIALEPKTPSGIAAVAATLKEDGLGDYWDTSDRDRDWDKILISGFLDALIAAAADRVPAQGPSARASNLIRAP
jgi:hypothetical protein